MKLIEDMDLWLRGKKFDTISQLRMPGEIIFSVGKCRNYFLIKL